MVSKTRYGLIRRSTGEHIDLLDTMEEAEAAVDHAVENDARLVEQGWIDKADRYDIVSVKGRIF